MQLIGWWLQVVHVVVSNLSVKTTLRNGKVGTHQSRWLPKQMVSNICLNGHAKWWYWPAAQSKYPQFETALSIGKSGCDREVWLCCCLNYEFYMEISAFFWEPQFRDGACKPKHRTGKKNTIHDYWKVNLLFSVDVDAWLTHLLTCFPPCHRCPFDFRGICQQRHPVAACNVWREHLWSP